MATDEWSAGFESTPAGSELRSLGDDRIRELKLAIRERLQKGGHYMQDTVAPYNKDGRHVRGVGDGPSWYKADATSLLLEATSDVLITAKEKLLLDKNLEVDGTTQLDGVTTINANTTIVGDLLLSGGTSDLTVDGATDFNGTVNCDGVVTTKAALKMDGNVVFVSASKTTNYTMVDGDSLIFADTTGGSVTITLPTPVAGSEGRLIIIRKWPSSGNTLTITGTVDGGGGPSSGAGTRYCFHLVQDQAATGWVRIAADFTT